MMKPLEIVKQAQGLKLLDEDKNPIVLKLLPPLSEEELQKLQASLPCPLPAEAEEFLRYCRGFDGILESLDFSGLSNGFGLEEIFPHPIPIGHDGFGNYWIVDLTKGSTTWGPIYFACHDAPVIIFQTESLAHFISEVLRLGTPPWESEIDDVHEKHMFRIWKENPGMMTHEQCLQSGDSDLIEFADMLGPSFLYIDLRKAKTGDGFSWGRYGPRTVNRRYGEKPIFAYEVRPTFWQRLFGKK